MEIPCLRKREMCYECHMEMPSLRALEVITVMTHHGCRSGTAWELGRGQHQQGGGQAYMRTELMGDGEGTAL